MEKNQDNYDEEEIQPEQVKALTFMGELFYFLITIAVTMLFIIYVAQLTVVDGTSMEPTLHNQDRLILNKISYRFSEPERFDIVVVDTNYHGAEHIIKRIIGLPGETVRIDEDGLIYINNELLEEHYGKETILPYRIGRAKEDIVLGENEYFVMGDNRNNSADSRESIIGNINIDNIVGKTSFRLWPLSKFGKIEK